LPQVKETCLESEKMSDTIHMKLIVRLYLTKN